MLHNATFFVILVAAIVTAYVLACPHRHSQHLHWLPKPVSLSLLYLPFVRAEPFYPVCHEILETLRYHTVKTPNLYLTLASICTASWQTDTKTELPC